MSCSSKICRFLPVLLIVLIAGCQSFSRNRVAAPLPPVNKLSISALNAAAAHRLASELAISEHQNGTGLVTTFVDMNDLAVTSPLGRLISEQVSAHLSQHDLKIRETRFTPDRIFIEPRAGEFALSREVQKIATEANASFIITGTYMTASQSLFVVARAIDVRTGVVIAAANYETTIDFPLHVLIRPDSIR